MSMYYSNNYHYVVKSVVKNLIITSISDNGFFHPHAMSIFPHMHPEYEIHISLSGAYMIESSDGVPYIMTPGKMLIIPPGFHHVAKPLIENIDSSNISKLTFRFTISDNSEKNATAQYGNLSTIFPQPNSSPLMLDTPFGIDFFDSLKNDFLSTSLFNDVMIENRFQYFWLCLLQHILKENDWLAPMQREHAFLKYSDSYSSRHDKIFLYLYEKQFSNISKKEMAKHLNISTRQLGRFFANYLGKSFHDYVTEERITYAKKLLMSTDKSIEAIASSIGYSSITSFYSLFKRKVGITPGHYRKLNKQGEKLIPNKIR